MDITEVRIKLMESEHDEKLLGFCSITIDHSFVVRDLKIINGGKGPFVAMPSRKLTDRCDACGGKNQVRAAYCNHCGGELDEDRSHKDSEGKAKLYADIAHPINSNCRDLIQDRVLEAYDHELELSQQPNYRCRYEDYGEHDSIVVSNGKPQPTPRVPADVNVRLDQPQEEPTPHRSRESTVNSEPDRDEFGAGLF